MRAFDITDDDAAKRPALAFDEIGMAAEVFHFGAGQKVTKAHVHYSA